MKIHVVIQEDLEEGGFVAVVPGLPGCVSQGETEEELIANIKEAISQWLEAAQLQDEPLEYFDKGSKIELPLVFT